VPPPAPAPQPSQPPAAAAAAAAAAWAAAAAPPAGAVVVVSVGPVLVMAVFAPPPEWRRPRWGSASTWAVWLVPVKVNVAMASAARRSASCPRRSASVWPAARPARCLRASRSLASSSCSARRAVRSCSHSALALAAASRCWSALALAAASRCRLRASSSAASSALRSSRSRAVAARRWSNSCCSLRVASVAATKLRMAPWVHTSSSIRVDSALPAPASRRMGARCKPPGPPATQGEYGGGASSLASGNCGPARLVAFQRSMTVCAAVSRAPRIVCWPR
jgi:hypothetical protein